MLYTTVVTCLVSHDKQCRPRLTTECGVSSGFGTDGVSTKKLFQFNCHSFVLKPHVISSANRPKISSDILLFFFYYFVFFKVINLF